MAKGFDLTTHHRNIKTGRITRVTPYKLEITNGEAIYIRDGIKYYANGELVNKPAPAQPVESVEPVAMTQAEIKEAAEKPVAKASKPSFK